jgi:succinoglycan biosynthesis transport protein ExoP
MESVDKEQFSSHALMSGAALELRQYLSAAKRRKLTILLPTIGVFLATLVVAMHLPNIYHAETVIMVDPQQVPNNYVATTVTSSISDRLSTIQQQVLSPSRLQKLIDSTGMYADLKGRMSEESMIRIMQNSISVDVTNSGGSRMSTFRIAFNGRNPKDVAMVANQLATMFIDENLKVREQQSEGTAEFLDHELQETKKELEKKEAEVLAIKTRNNTDLPESKQYHLEVLGNLRSQLTASQDRVNRAQQEKVYLQSVLISSHPTVDLDTGGGGATASPHQSEIQKLEARISDLEARYGPNHPDVRRARKDLADLRKKEGAEAGKASVQQQPQISSEVLAAEARRNPVVESQLNKLTQDIEEQAKVQAQLQQQIDLHVEKLQQIPIFEQQMAGMMRDYDTLRSHYTSLLDKKLAAQMSTALESHEKGERFVILDSATPPTKPYAPNRPLIAFAGLFGGILSGIALAAVMEISDESVRSEHEAAQITGMPVLAGIPHLMSRSEERRNQLRTLGAVLGTVACSLLVGFVLSKVTSLLS